MDVLPLHPTAAAVLGTSTTWTPTTLAAALSGTNVGVIAGLLAGFAVPDAHATTPVTTTALLGAARREAELFDDVHVRCEHLLMGILRTLDADRELQHLRDDFQRLMAARAFNDYTHLTPLPRPLGAPSPHAVLLAGIPGTGKSTLAEALARELNAPVFSMDWQLGALVPFGVLRAETMEPLSEVMLAASMARQLQLGQSVILDATTLRTQERQRLRTIADNLDATFTGIECLCTDEQLHRQRLLGRERGIPGWPATVTFDHVIRMRERWEPWNEPHLTIDSATQTPTASLQHILDYIHRDDPVVPGAAH